VTFEFNQKILDHGYVKYIGHMGSDETFVEAARMSTGKGFFGWYWDEDTYSDCICATCNTHNLLETLPVDENGCSVCNNCWEITIKLFDEPADWDGGNYPEPKLLGKKGAPRDLGLLNTLYSNRHQTPFEMGELCIEVKAPLMVFREWHRHRTQSYNEFSARYSQMPNEHYLPELSRFQKQSTANKQGSAAAFATDDASMYRKILAAEQQTGYLQYEKMVRDGMAKEVARINTPVSRYSKMRAKTDVRNWLAFLFLRMEMGAQWEIRQYAHAVASIIHTLYPRTYELFLEYDLMGVRFSRTEMRLLRAVIESFGDASNEKLKEWSERLQVDTKTHNSVVSKITTDREELYRSAIKSS
jgi:thymidylate synthase (FAD)